MVYLAGTGCSYVGKRYPQDKSVSSGQVLGKPIAFSTWYSRWRYPPIEHWTGA